MERLEKGGKQQVKLAEGKKLNPLKMQRELQRKCRSSENPIQLRSGSAGIP